MTRQNGNDNGSGGSRSPAQQLAGLKLNNGWSVGDLEVAPVNSTGGNFSSSYIVYSEKWGRAFLKAMDYDAAFSHQDTAQKLYDMTKVYLYERYLLEKCRAERMTRIVKILDHGRIAPKDNDPRGVVQYLIFELANSDIRKWIGCNETNKLAWALQMMHQVTVALQQLHSAQIAHQDLKPSNVLVFGSEGAKLGDLGRATEHENTSPFDDLICAGDMTYAPPELLYGKIYPEWSARRLGCDFYLLGSLVLFLSKGVSMTHLLLGRLDKRYHPKFWTGTYDEVLPYVQRVFLQIIRELKEQVQPTLAPDIADLVSQLCNPLIEQRGLPLNKGVSNRYSLQRLVSKLNLLHKRFELSPLRDAPIIPEMQK